MIEFTPMGFLILTWKGFLWLAALFFIVGMLGALMIPFVVRALDNTKKARAKYAKMIPEEAQRTIDTLYRLNAEGAEREKDLDRQLASMKRLARERRTFNRYNDMRTHAAMLGKEVK